MTPPQWGVLSPHQILFGRNPLLRGLSLSGDGMTTHANGFFGPQETASRGICQQLQKAHAVRAKTAPRSAAPRVRGGDPVWVPRPRPTGTRDIKTWFTPGEVVRRIGEETYRIKVGPWTVQGVA